jgi:serine protease inhibitor
MSKISTKNIYKGTVSNIDTNHQSYCVEHEISMLNEWLRKIVRGKIKLVLTEE